MFCARWSPANWSACCKPRSTTPSGTRRPRNRRPPGDPRTHRAFLQRRRAGRVADARNGCRGGVRRGGDGTTARGRLAAQAAALRQERGRAFQSDLGIAQVDSLERPRRGVVLAGAHVRGRRGPPLHRPPSWRALPRKTSAWPTPRRWSRPWPPSKPSASPASRRAISIWRKPRCIWLWRPSPTRRTKR